ncbi:MAG: ABC transporter permease [Deltaproteobacteria bacterium]|nr:ABC transporter permease [Deltaproteobacteria bacterium]
MLRHKFVSICSLFLLLLFLCALFPKILTPHGFDRQFPQFLLMTPTHEFWFGTDELGRDLLARVLYGARISLACALLATTISALFGIFYGSLSGFVGGKMDQILMRILDVLYSIPDLLFYILLGLFLGRNFWGLLITLSSLGWVSVARIVRGEILKYKELPFVESAQALGLPRWRILLRHLIPQTRDPIVVTLLFKIPAVILAESTLSFIGLGLAPPYSSWGTLASEGYQALGFYPHLILFPSLFIFLTIFSFQTIGNGLAGKMDSH